MRTDRNIKSKSAKISPSTPLTGPESTPDSASAKPVLSRIENIRAAFKRLPMNIEHACHAASAGLPYYVPGILLMAMACSLVTAPKMFLPFSAGLILYMGFVAIYFARRFRELRVKFAEVVKHIEARIYIRGQDPGWGEQQGVDAQGPDKKTVLH
jgi:hypothetical protein